MTHIVDASLAERLAQEVRAQQARQSTNSTAQPRQLCYGPSPSTRLQQGGEWACPHGARAMRSSASSPVLLTSFFVEHEWKRGSIRSSPY